LGGENIKMPIPKNEKELSREKLALTNLKIRQSKRSKSKTQKKKSK
jgi:hypothetical protein